MYNADRRSKEFIDGLHYFLDVVEANKQNGFMCCPCGDCKNKKDYSSSRILHSHIFLMVSYPIIFVGKVTKKKGVIMEDSEEEG
jgi:hypothetical protein